MPPIRLRVLEEGEASFATCLRDTSCGTTYLDSQLLSVPHGREHFFGGLGFEYYMQDAFEFVKMPGADGEEQDGLLVPSALIGKE